MKQNIFFLQYRLLKQLSQLLFYHKNFKITIFYMQCIEFKICQKEYLANEKLCKAIPNNVFSLRFEIKN